MQKVTFISQNLKLVGNLSIPLKSKPVGVLILHGAGTASKERFIELQAQLAEAGYSSFAFDFRGVGESDGVFSDSTLNQRLDDAVCAYDVLAEKVDQIVVLGSSMGAHVAVRLTEQRKTTGLILLYGAAYAKEAEDKPFNHEFTQILRTENSWQTSPVFPILEKYSQPKLVVYGEKDQVIPKAVQLKFKQVLKNPDKFVMLPEAGHLILAPKNELEAQDKMNTIKEIIRYLKKL